MDGAKKSFCNESDLEMHVFEECIGFAATRCTDASESAPNAHIPPICGQKN